MQSIKTLDQIDKQPCCVFASSGTTDSSFISSGLISGLSEANATPTEDGGILLSRAIVNSIGFLATTDLFMSKIGCLRTYVAGVSYSKYAKLEYVDNSSISHTVFATASGLGNFNANTSLISNSGWKISDNPVARLVPNFN